MTINEQNQRLPWILSLLLLVSVAGAAQTRGQPSAEDTAKWPIRSLEVEGNRNYTDQQVLTVADLKVGQPANREMFDEARERLINAGAFESVGFRWGPSAGGEGYTAVIEVVEIQHIYPIRFEYIDAPDEELRAWLKQKDPLFAEEVPGTKELILRYAEAIEQYLEQQDRGEKIMGELTTDRPEQLYIMFHPARAMPVVAEVDFTGNEVIATGNLREAIHGVAIGARYTESRFRELLNTSVRPLYEVRGRVQVAFPKIAAEPAPGDVNGLKITVEVVEGETFDLGQVHVEGTASMNKALLQVADLTVGDIANFMEVQAALQRIDARMRQEGYMKVASRAEREVNDADRTVDLVLQVEPGPQFHFGKLFIEGLDVHGEHEIRRIWGLVEGDPFDAEFPDFFLQRVREDGVFDFLRKTRSSIKVNEDDLTADVTLIFNPKPAKTLPSTFDDPLSLPPKR